MDPITIIVTALAAGAVAGLKPTAEQVVKDAYQGIKALIQRKYARVSLETLEEGPASDAHKDVVREDLQKANAGADAELLLQAQKVIDAIRQHSPESAVAVGVTIEDLEAQSLRIRDIVVSSGTGVSMKQVKVGGDVEIVGVRAGDGHSKA